MNIIKRYIEKFKKIISRPAMRILPGNLAFFLVLSIVPLITLLGMICSMFSTPWMEFLNSFYDIIPNGVAELLQPMMTFDINTPHMIIFLIIGFFVASNGAHAIILASNALYESEGKNYLFRRIKGLFLTFILMLLFLFALVVLAFGNNILKFILDFEIFTNVSSKIYSIFVLLKWPTAFFLIFAMVKALYTLAPDKRVASKYVNKGALFTTGGWMITTAFYSLYANNIANYSRFYGSLSSIAVLMIWVYIISYIFVVGIAINTSYYDLSEERE